ncbi:hypothetical protein HB837_15355 [Listeria innocua]|uniref:hypothetical protein n=1 Tax=Listeria innocua TaxID=1642 RepID=UPI00162600C6|nr:hypothetical protein [Listeria innocua]MBC1353787.1 hypothetical protein [Listeria innocua]
MDSTDSIVAIAAIIAPILTAIVNNRHYKKMAIIEFERAKYEKETLRIKRLFEKFLTNYGAYAGHVTDPNFSELLNSYYACLPFIPENQYAVFQNFLTNLTDANIDTIAETRKNLEHEIIPIIRSIISQL